MYKEIGRREMREMRANNACGQHSDTRASLDSHSQRERHCRQFNGEDHIWADEK